MQKMLRRIRGAIGMGFTWAAAWSAVRLVPRWVFGFNADAHSVSFSVYSASWGHILRTARADRGPLQV